MLLSVFGFILDLLRLPFRLLGRVRASSDVFVTLTIDGPVADIVARPRFWEVRRKRATSLHEVAELVDAVVVDAHVRGLLVTLKHLGGGMATAISLRALLARVKDAGKEVVVQLPLGGGSKEIIAASSATKLLVGPTAQIAPLGFLSQHRYVKRALDNAGIEPEVFACGEFKSAGETLVRNTMSEGQREQLDELLDRFQDALLVAVMEKTNGSRESASAVIDGSPYFGAAAVGAGLADAAVYEDEVFRAIGLTDAHPTRHVVESDAFMAQKKPLLRPILPRPIVAVIPVHGAIAHASSPFGSFATDEQVTGMVRRARLSRRVKGVILHVDSPGGSALASDRMHHEIEMLAREKPVVTCMANVAASGGYYVAAPTQRIVCESMSVTGSIGVVGARLTFEPLLARLGIHTETLRRGAHVGLLSPTSPISDDERAALRRELDATYHAFVRVVASGRKMREDEVEALARGRVYTGAEALKKGLVDHVGGFDVAIRELRKLLPEATRASAVPVVLRPPRQPIPVLDPPEPKESARAVGLAFLQAILPSRELVLVSLAARGERALLVWTGFSGVGNEPRD